MMFCSLSNFYSFVVSAPNSALFVCTVANAFTTYASNAAVDAAAVDP